MKEHIVVLILCSIQLIQVHCNKNVVLMIADDFRSSIYFSFTCKIKSLFRPNIGVYEESNSFSSPGMKTPNLDHLASKSLVLTNAYTQVTWLVLFTFWFKSLTRLRCVDPAGHHSWLEGGQTPSDAMTTTICSGKIFQTQFPCRNTSKRMDTRH